MDSCPHHIKSSQLHYSSESTSSALNVHEKCLFIERNKKEPGVQNPPLDSIEMICSVLISQKRPPKDKTNTDFITLLQPSCRLLAFPTPCDVGIALINVSALTPDGE